MDTDVIRVVKNIIRRWPAYRSFAAGTGIDPLRITSIGELPVIDREFISHAIHMVPVSKVRSLIPSSGSTGADFSFGLFGDAELRNASKAIDDFLRCYFNTKTKKTILLNLLPGAISIPSSCVSVASIGVRIDTALHAIETFKNSFDQMILAGEPLFMKSVIEKGTSLGISWKYIPLFIIVGGDWFSEGYRLYIEETVGKGRVFSSMGMAELGLNYFFETEETIMLRQLLMKDRLLSKILFGDVGFCPMLFSYSADYIYVETIPEYDLDMGSIAITTLDIGRILPLIRYKSGDKGRLLSREVINRALDAAGYKVFVDTAGPRILAYSGRGRGVSGIYPEQVKDMLYMNSITASTNTGNFRLTKRGPGVVLEIQLREDISFTEDIMDIYREALSSLPLLVKLYTFETFPYPLDFERKVRYVDESNYCKDRRGKETELSLTV